MQGTGEAGGIDPHKKGFKLPDEKKKKKKPEEEKSDKVSKNALKPIGLSKAQKRIKKKETQYTRDPDRRDASLHKSSKPPSLTVSKGKKKEGEVLYTRNKLSRSDELLHTHKQARKEQLKKMSKVQSLGATFVAELKQMSSKEIAVSIFGVGTENKPNIKLLHTLMRAFPQLPQEEQKKVHQACDLLTTGALYKENRQTSLDKDLKSVVETLQGAGIQHCIPFLCTRINYEIENASNLSTVMRQDSLASKILTAYMTSPQSTTLPMIMSSFTSNISTLIQLKSNDKKIKKKSVSECEGMLLKMVRNIELNSKSGDFQNIQNIYSSAYNAMKAKVGHDEAKKFVIGLLLMRQVGPGFTDPYKSGILSSGGKFQTKHPITMGTGVSILSRIWQHLANDYVQGQEITPNSKIPFAKDFLNKQSTGKTLEKLFDLLVPKKNRV